MDYKSDRFFTRYYYDNYGRLRASYLECLILKAATDQERTWLGTAFKRKSCKVPLLALRNSGFEFDSIKKETVNTPSSRDKRKIKFLKVQDIDAASRLAYIIYKNSFWDRLRKKHTRIEAPIEPPYFLKDEWDSDVLPVEIALKLAEAMPGYLQRTEMVFFYAVCFGFEVEELSELFLLSEKAVIKAAQDGMREFKLYATTRYWWYNVDLNLLPICTAYYSFAKAMLIRKKANSNWSSIGLSTLQKTIMPVDRNITRERALQLSSGTARLLPGMDWANWPTIRDS